MGGFSIPLILKQQQHEQQHRRQNQTKPIETPAGRSGSDWQIYQTTKNEQVKQNKTVIQLIVFFFVP